MLTLLSKVVPTKFIEIFWLKIFFICHRCQRHRWSTLSCKYLREFPKKFETVLMGYSGAGGKLIHKKTRSKKSRDIVPLKQKLCHFSENSTARLYHVKLCKQTLPLNLAVARWPWTLETLTLKETPSGASSGDHSGRNNYKDTKT